MTQQTFRKNLYFVCFRIFSFFFFFIYNLLNVIKHVERKEKWNAWFCYKIIMHLMQSKCIWTNANCEHKLEMVFINPLLINGKICWCNSSFLTLLNIVKNMSIQNSNNNDSCYFKKVVLAFMYQLGKSQLTCVECNW